MAGETQKISETEYACAWPGCDYTADRADKVRLHYYAAHRRERLAGKKKGGQAAAGAERGAGCSRPGCEGVFRVLSSADTLEAAALRDGYKLVCPTCGRLA